MFRIEIFVEDTKLYKVLNGLVGLTINPVVPQPVANAGHKNGKVHALTNGSVLEEFRHRLKKEKVEMVTPAYFKDFLTSVGRKAGGYSNYLTKAIDAGYLSKRRKGAGNKTAYPVVREALNG